MPMNPKAPYYVIAKKLFLGGCIFLWYPIWYDLAVNLSNYEYWGGYWSPPSEFERMLDAISRFFNYPEGTNIFTKPYFVVTGLCAYLMFVWATGWRQVAGWYLCMLPFMILNLIFLYYKTFVDFEGWGMRLVATYFGLTGMDIFYLFVVRRLAHISTGDMWYQKA